MDQGSQTEESGEQDYVGHVDVIAESAAASGVTMETEETVEGMDVEEEETSTVDASSLIEEGGQTTQQGTVTEVVQGSGDVMATVELSTEATALQAAVEALVSASQQQMVTHEESAATGKEIFGDEAAAASLMGASVVYPSVAEDKSRVADLAARMVAEEVESGEVQYVEEPSAVEETPTDADVEEQEV